MKSYKQLYFFLFNQLTDAIEDLRENRPLSAVHRLMEAQRQTEEWHMETDILPDNDTEAGSQR